MAKIRYLSQAIVVVGLVLLVGIPIQAADYPYSVTDLGSFYPMNMNNKGDIIGFVNSKSFLYSDGIRTELPTLGGSYCYATCINDKGQIVGDLITSAGDIHAFFYSDGHMADLGNFGSKRSSAYGINNSGQIALNVSDGSMDESIQAFLYDSKNGSTINLGNFGGKLTVAKGINSQGEIAGYSTTPDGIAHAFVWSNGNLTDIGTLGGNSLAETINDDGQIAGSSIAIDGNQHAFLYSGNQLKDINGVNLNSLVSDINNNGDLVGGAFPNAAYLYSNGSTTYLNNLIDPSFGIILNGAISINDEGRILATDSLSHAYLLIPVPEPASAFLFVNALIMIILIVIFNQHLKFIKGEKHVSFHL